MIYTCNDCSYRGKASAGVGACPACGSFNMVAARAEDAAQAKPARWRLALLAALWLYLVALLVWKFFI